MRSTICFILVGLLCGIENSHAQTNTQFSPNPQSPQTNHQSAPATKSAVVIIDSGSSDLLIESFVRSTAEKQLRDNSYTIIKGQSLGGDIPKRLLACTGKPSCSASVLKNIQANHAFFFSLRPETNAARNFKLVVRDFNVKNGQINRRSMRRCPECKDEADLSIFTKQLIEGLCNSNTAQTLPNTNEHQRLRTQKKTLVFRRESSVQEIPQEKEALPLKKILTFGTLGAGVTSIGLGTFFVFLDGPVIKNGQRTERQYDTRHVGYASLGTGLALVGISAWIWSRRSSKEQESRYTLNLQSHTHGGSLSFSSKF